ncbi:Chromosome transmission fidelity protein 8 [Cinnamomum micranthum f. kanehirae]|uniref:Chromosome transmission fidelity protein 8 n=1 Tax=Cinnamomum micranthum f. kanehirae TaxID=337451 RepID=A0A443N0V2_9MAGN|nr:Chromosome transmission fidelity protein 8 [Cinnamomum micranthum f. kanehirae]
MEIKVKCSCGEGSCPEWAIIELQGVVEAQPSIRDCIQNLEIGRLCHSSSQGSYTFTVGYHELSGTKTVLKKPLLVLKKKKKRESDEAEESSSESLRRELEVIGVIRHRILFKTRPKALISRQQIKEKKPTC